MLVILNSDVLWGNYLDRLPASIESFLKSCKAARHAVVIPETSLLEVTRHQSDLAAKAREELNAALRLLDQYGINHAPVVSDAVIPSPDVLAQMQAVYESISVRPATQEEYSDALRRASLHLAPQSAESKSDEMRDLVIWATAIEQAKVAGQALLISRDEVHAGRLGSEEANLAGLIRARSLDEALGVLGLHTPAGDLLAKLLSSAWPLATQKGLRLDQSAGLCGVVRAAFVQGERGPSEAKAFIHLRNSDGKPITADVHYIAEDGNATMKLSNVQEEKKQLPPIEVEFSQPPQCDKSGGDDLQHLRSILEG